MKSFWKPPAWDSWRSMLFWAAAFCILAWLFSWGLSILFVHTGQQQPVQAWLTPFACRALCSLLSLAALAPWVWWLHSRKETRESLWWLTGLGLGLLLMGAGYLLQRPVLQTPLEWVQAGIGLFFPALLTGLGAGLMLMAGGLVPAAVYLCGMDLVSVLPVPAAQVHPAMTLLRALLPVIFLMVLNIDLSEEPEESLTAAGQTKSKEQTAQSEEPADRAEEGTGLPEETAQETPAERADQQEAPQKQKAGVSWKRAVRTVCTGLFWILLAAGLLFSMGLLPWIPTSIATGSMEPVLHTGDLAVIDTTRKTPEPGDIIQYSHDGISVVHRVAEVLQDEDGVRYITKGDSNPSADAKPVAPENIEGTLCGRIPWAGWLTLWLHAVPSAQPDL